MAFLAYGPWHGAAQLGKRTLVGADFGPLKRISWPGVMHIAWIGLVLLALAVPIWRELRRRKPDWLEFAILATPWGILANVREFDSLTVVSLENSVFLCSILFLLLRSRSVSEGLPWFRAAALPVLLGSYLLAIGLPFLIPIEGHEIWRSYKPVARYIGWVGEGTAYALVGQALFIGGAIALVRRMEVASLDNDRQILPVAAMLAGIAGVTLNVHRISMFSLVVCALALLAGARQRKRRSLTPILLAAALMGGLLTQGMLKKTFHYVAIDPKEEWLEYQDGRYLGRFPLAPAWWRAMIFDRLDWATNGRIGLGARLLQDARGHLINGMGTGWAPRILTRSKARVSEPQSDYLRVLVDHGLIGLAAMLAIGIGAIRRLWGSPACAGLFALAVTMLTENILVFPAFGYGPILLMGVALAVPFPAQADSRTRAFTRLRDTGVPAAIEAEAKP